MDNRKFFQKKIRNALIPALLAFLLAGCAQAPLPDPLADFGEDSALPAIAPLWSAPDPTDIPTPAPTIAATGIPRPTRKPAAPKSTPLPEATAAAVDLSAVCLSVNIASCAPGGTQETDGGEYVWFTAEYGTYREYVPDGSSPTLRAENAQRMYPAALACLTFREAGVSGIDGGKLVTLKDGISHIDPRFLGLRSAAALDDALFLLAEDGTVTRVGADGKTLTVAQGVRAIAPVSERILLLTENGLDAYAADGSFLAHRISGAADCFAFDGQTLLWSAGGKVFRLGADGTITLVYEGSAQWLFPANGSVYLLSGENELIKAADGRSVILTPAAKVYRPTAYTRGIAVASEADGGLTVFLPFGTEQ